MVLVLLDLFIALPYQLLPLPPQSLTEQNKPQQIPPSPQLTPAIKISGRMDTTLNVKFHSELKQDTIKKPKMHMY